MRLENTLDGVAKLYCPVSDLSSNWEDYLLLAFRQRQGIKRGRGCTQATRWIEKSTLRRRPNKALARLGSYVKRFERLHNASGLPMDPVARASLWKKVDQATGLMARSYGVPGNLPVSGTPQEVEKAVLAASVVHYRRALEVEYRQLDETEKLNWRIKLHENRGVNKHTSDLLKKTWFGSPAVQEAGVVHRRGDEVLALATKHWSAYYDGDPSDVTEQWLAYLTTLPHANCNLEPITGQMVKSAVMRAKVSSAPSCDSWRYADFKKLPMLAYEQLADVHNEMEKMQQISEAMLQSWTSLIGGERPVAPLKLRPIAVLSSAWRIYAAIRYQTLTPWLHEVLPTTLHAYIQGRGVQTATSDLIAKLEEVSQARRQGRDVELHVIALDASKAFPSVSRSHPPDLESPGRNGAASDSHAGC